MHFPRLMDGGTEKYAIFDKFMRIEVSEVFASSRP